MCRQKQFTDEEKREKRAETQRKYREANKEKIKNLLHDNYLKNKENHLKKTKEWYENNKEALSVKGKERRQFIKKLIEEHEHKQKENNILLLT